MCRRSTCAPRKPVSLAADGGKLSFSRHRRRCYPPSSPSTSSRSSVLRIAVNSRHCLKPSSCRCSDELFGRASTACVTPLPRVRSTTGISSASAIRPNCSAKTASVWRLAGSSRDTPRRTFLLHPLDGIRRQSPARSVEGSGMPPAIAPSLCASSLAPSCAPLTCGQKFTAKYFGSMNSSMPVTPPSRPNPLCLAPPKGAAGSDIRPRLMAIMPLSMPLPTRSARERSRE